MKTIFLMIMLLVITIRAQNVFFPVYYQMDPELSAGLQEIVTGLELDLDFDTGEDGLEQISLAVIDLVQEKPRLGGVNPDNFIYPASVYKMYVAAEILHQISRGDYNLDSMVVVRSPNDVDRSKEITSDPRPLLRGGDTVSVNYLIDLMITRSDNSAANCLIDLAGRKHIDSLLHRYNWHGSEVTRKFLNRKFEDPGYEKVRGTETCALHAADFMYLIYTNQLVNPWVSMQMRSFLARQLDNTKISTGLPENTMFFHKTGWYSYWTNDVGIVDDGRVRYIVSCFLPLREEQALPKFTALSRRIFALISERNE